MTNNTKLLSTDPRNVARRAWTAARRAQYLADLAAIRDLAAQDVAGDPADDVYTVRGEGSLAARAAIESWRSSAVQAGDRACVEVIDRLDSLVASREYLAARLATRKVRS